MYDKYIKTIFKDGRFLAGYNRQSRLGGTMKPFLFSTLRILYVAAGSADWQIGSRVWHIGESDLVVVNNTELRCFVAASEDFTYEVFAFVPSVFYAESTCVKLFYNRSDSFVPVFSVADANYPRMISLIGMLSDLFLSGEGSNEEPVLASSLITSIVTYMILDRSDSLEAESSSTATAVLISNAVDYIQKNPSVDLSVSVLAGKVGLSSGYFCVCFKRYTGTTPAKFISCARVAKVVHLLRSNPNTNVLDAALASGFESSSGFYRAFKSICGETPKNYLKTSENKGHI